VTKNDKGFEKIVKWAYLPFSSFYEPSTSFYTFLIPPSVTSFIDGPISSENACRKEKKKWGWGALI
jgi:hypothetical protein